MISGSFGNRPVSKIRHFLIAILLGLFRDQYLTKMLIKCIHYVLDNSLTWLGIPFGIEKAI